MLAMIPSDLCDLRQNAALPGSRRGTLSRRHGLQKFISRIQADPPHARLPNQSAPGTFLVMQQHNLQEQFRRANTAVPTDGMTWLHGGWRR